MLCLQAEFGRLDVLVNNAGYTWDGVIHKMGDKQWQVRKFTCMQ
jgi:NADP-dependent 3-hydroxy acid dehydrogenase YdfG